MNFNHLDFCDKKLIDNVNWSQYRVYDWTDLNLKAYRQKYVYGMGYMEIKE